LDKQTARVRGQAARMGLSKENRQRLDTILLRQMQERAARAAVVGCYVSVYPEADSRRFLAWCLEEGKIAAVPKTRHGTLVFYRMKRLEDLVPGALGIPEPQGSEEISLDDIPVMFVPGLAFDRKGNRAGHGAGYYDRALKNYNGCRIGICYPRQMVDSLETNARDIPMDEILFATGTCLRKQDK
jgi:5-formyltetrahydrofolate cyclo-ligase